MMLPLTYRVEGGALSSKNRSTNLIEAADQAGVPRSGYDRRAVGVGIVHFGVGGFHRSHQAAYLDTLMGRGEARDWGICGVGVRAADRRMAEVLQAQDGLYTLIERGADPPDRARVIGSLVDYLFAPDDPEAVLARLTSPGTRIVSLTITEGGYCIDDRNGEFIPEGDVMRDLDSRIPRSAFGYLVEALARRRHRGIPPFTVMSCDNLPGNGRVARKAITSFAQLRDDELGAWVAEAVAFPNSMVDRITPVTAEVDRLALRTEFGVDDRWPVVCEPFAQWVLEDAFPSGRPPLEAVGVSVVDDVAPFELVKLRLLNGGHQAIGYLGLLLGHRYVHEAVGDPTLRRFLRHYLDAEASATLDHLPDIDLRAYTRDILERFVNPRIKDSLGRLCEDGSDRIPKFVLPTVRDQLGSGGGIEGAAALVAGWARFVELAGTGGLPELVDRDGPDLRRRARDPDPSAFLLDRRLFGDLAENPRFSDAYGRTAAAIRAEGARAAIESILP